MKIKYELIIFWNEVDQALGRSIAEPGGVIVSYNDNNEPISIEVLNATKRQLVDPAEMNLAIVT